VAAPSLIYPFGGLAAPVPIIFRWTPAQTGVFERAFGPYELQISDRPDVLSHILFEVIVGSTSYVFTNRNTGALSGFTGAQPPGIPLSGGRYFWRVRAISTGFSTLYSELGTFRLLQNAAITTPLHDLAVEGVGVASAPQDGEQTLIVATVSNTGTFGEHGATVTIRVNGVPIGSGAVPPLAPNESVQLVAPWTPQRAGVAQIFAMLTAIDMNPQNQTASSTVVVSPASPSRTTMLGTVEARDGSFVLADAHGRTLAILTAPQTMDLASFVGRAVRIEGALSRGSGGLHVFVQAISAPPKTLDKRR